MGHNVFCIVDGPFRATQKYVGFYEGGSQREVSRNVKYVCYGTYVVETKSSNCFIMLGNSYYPARVSLRDFKKALKKKIG